MISGRGYMALYVGTPSHPVVSRSVVAWLEETQPDVNGLKIKNLTGIVIDDEGKLAQAPFLPEPFLGYVDVGVFSYRTNEQTTSLSRTFTEKARAILATSDKKKSL